MEIKLEANKQNIITEPKWVLKTLINLSKLLDKVSLRYFFTGGLAYRIMSADQKQIKLKPSDLREHKDIDMIVFAEDFFEFLEIFRKTKKYKIWFPAEVGMQRRLPGEHHFVSLKDQKTGVIIALFRAVKSKKGRLVRTILYENFHPQLIFNYRPIKFNGVELKIVSPEWLYYNSILRGKNKDDGQLIYPCIDFEKFNLVQYEAHKIRTNRLEYKKEIESFGILLRKKKLI